MKSREPIIKAPAFGGRKALLGPVIRLLLLGAVGTVGPGRREVRAESSAYSEYEVKATFLFHFVQFIKWPSASGSQMTIGILGDDPFGGALDKIIQGESVDGRKLVIKRSRRVDDLKGCQIVFIANSAQGGINANLAGLAGTNALTVGEQEGFVKQGGMIGFTSGGEKVRFEINTAAAQRAGIEISSRLLKLASRVGSW